MNAKKSVRQYKPAAKNKTKAKAKKQSAWKNALGWFRSNIGNSGEVDPQVRGEHKDNLRFVWGAVFAILSLAILFCLLAQ